MRHITVYMSDGDTISTSINGTDEEIIRHYLGNRFEAGSDTEHHVALCIHFHDTDRRFGLRIKCIEHAGVSRNNMNTEERIRRAASMGFVMLTEGTNFDTAIYAACARYLIERNSYEFLTVRSRMAKDLYEW